MRKKPPDNAENRDNVVVILPSDVPLWFALGLLGLAVALVGCEYLGSVRVVTTQTTTSEYFSTTILISLSFSGGKLSNQAYYSPSKRLDTRPEKIGLNYWSQFARHNLVHKTEFVDNNLKFAKEMTKNQRSELELSTEFVSHNLVHKTEFVDNNLKFAYEMTIEFNDSFWRELLTIVELELLVFLERKTRVPLEKPSRQGENQ